MRAVAASVFHFFLFMARAHSETRFSHFFTLNARSHILLNNGLLYHKWMEGESKVWAIYVPYKQSEEKGT